MAFSWPKYPGGVAHGDGGKAPIFSNGLPLDRLSAVLSLDRLMKPL